MFEDIQDLIQKKMYEEALGLLRDKNENVKNGSLKTQVEKLYQAKNDVLLKTVGPIEFIDISLSFIDRGNLSIYLFDKLNPGINIGKLDKDRKNIIRKYNNISDKLVDEAKTENKKYIEELKKISKVILDERLSIVILGESGVGKSYMAKKIHELSNRSGRFSEMNCGAFSGEDRLNQNLWGWERGSYSGAIKGSLGKIGYSNKGTLFLDEIDRMPAGTRDALITFIDSKMFQRLGSIKDLPADVRLIFGTNKNLRELVITQKMEEDFYYRIKHITLTIPSLRERKEDFYKIVVSEMEQINKELKSEIYVDPDVIGWLSEFSWPGNYRELSAYLRVIMNECLSEGISNISYRFLKNKPPIESPMLLQEEFESFQRQLHKYINYYIEIDKSWAEIPTDRNFLGSFVSPILAKIFIEDFGDMPEKNDQAMKYVGISGENVGTSRLHRYYKMYPILLKKLFNKDAH